MLSHPLIVEAAETLFVPVAVKNNTSGDEDAKTRKEFKEPSWNNPVVRFLDAGKRDLAPRIHDDWSLAKLAESMCASLEKQKQQVPAYLRLLAAEERAKRTGRETAAFAMT